MQVFSTINISSMGVPAMHVMTTTFPQARIESHDADDFPLQLNHHFDESTSHSSRSSQVASAAMEGWNVGDYNLVADVESRTATTLDD
jgi:hypothetical protein